MCQIFTGFDSAWTVGNRGAIAHLIIDDHGVEFGEPETVSFAEALTSINRVGANADLHVIAIDQPLIVQNKTGSRPVEPVLGSLVTRLGGAIQPSNTGKIGMFDAGAPIWPFLRDLDANQDPMAIPGAVAGRFAFECWPVAAQIAFASRGTEIQPHMKYNPANAKTYSWAAWRSVNQPMAATARDLNLPDVAAWFDTSADLAKPGKNDQDKVDAAICVLIAWLWWKDGLAKSAVMGDTELGYIVTPVSSPMAGALRTAADSRGVPFRSDVASSDWIISRMPLTTIIIRPASPADCKAIAAIYNQGIVDRVATLETTERTAEERAEWLAAKGERFPVLVATDDVGQVCGWASLNQFNPRPAYDHVADISVYIDRDQRGRGIGEQLLVALEEQARDIGFHKLVLAAFPTNHAGMRLYQRRGFTTVGIYHEQGKLDGRWVDTIIMEKLLA